VTRTIVSLGFRLLFSLGLLAALVLFVADPSTLLRDLVAMRWPALVGAILLTALDRAVMAWKWRLLLLSRGVAIPLWTAIRAYFCTSFAGLFLPVTVGADAIRVLAVRRYGVHDVTASIVVERTLGALGIGTVGLLSCAIMASWLTPVSVRDIVVALITAMAALVFVFFVSLKFAGWWAIRDTGSRVPLRRLAQAYAAYRDRPRTLVVFYVASVAESLLPPLISFVAAAGLGLRLPFALFVATVPIALTVARLPISLGGFGVQEASFVYLAGLLGVPAQDGLTIMLMTDIVLVVTLLPAAFDGDMLGLGRRSPAAAGLGVPGRTAENAKSAGH
jgi:uncharacterized membrane protein YbhN (UPF0104 family)